MTNLEAIRNGTHEGLNEFIKKLDAENIAGMFSEISCNACICKEYCYQKGFFSDLDCQETIEEWLNKDY